MPSKRKTMHGALVLVVGLAAAAILAGVVVGAQFDLMPSDEVQASLRSDAMVRVAEIPAADGMASRSVYVQPTSTGLLCLWDAPSSTPQARQGGCNSADDPLAGRAMTISLAYDGGPATSSVTDARLIGLASNDVASVQVLMSDGTRRRIPMRRELAVSSEAGRFRAFAYRFPRMDFARNLGPTAVIALGGTGAELDRLTTGYGG
jgi:hypothetical protein